MRAAVEYEQEPIAIVGIGCRFPGGADEPNAYWRLLTEGRNAIVDVPSDRWQLERFYNPDLQPGTTPVRRGGFLQEPVDRFDAAFFGISPREADHIDPQQRLLLEVAFEALEDGCIPLEHVAGSSTGVFVGGFTLDYSQLQFGSQESRRALAAHTATGVVLTMLANRISHAFDLLGPSMSVDTACSSSLVAIHLACRSLWSRESSVALAGGVNLMLAPFFTIAASQGGFLSPTSSSRAFDAAADGYVRGEGAGIVVLKPLTQAQRNGDRIYGLVRSTAVVQDGRTPGITVPNGASQQRAMEAALASAGVTPASVGYVEAHGTGTALGDPIEVSAIRDVYGSDQPDEIPCLIGSGKTNIGHLEAAAGVAGLIKTVLSLAHREVPPHLNLTTLNPLIDLGLRLRVPLRREPLPECDGVVRAAVNSFGFGGTNAHALLEGPPQPSRRRRPAPAADAPGPIPPLFPLAARSKGALAELANRYLACLERGESAADLAAAAARWRSHHRQARLAVVMEDEDTLASALANVRDGAPHPAVHQSRTTANDSPLAFVFTGMGPQWWGMGRQLLAEHPVFREQIERCDAALQPLAGWSLVDELRIDESRSRMHEAAVAQPASFALQLGLAAVWSSLGLAPGAIVGHSAGEIAAAHLAGALDFEDAVTVIFHRARLQHLTSGEGRVLAVALPEEAARRLPAVHEGRVALAAVNSPASVALSGPLNALTEIARTCAADGAFARLVDGDVPYHSPAMDRLEPDLRACLAEVTPREPTIPLYSTVLGGQVHGCLHDADYWWRNVRLTVRLAEAALAMVDDGVRSFVELGPHPALSHALGECLRDRGEHGVAVPSLRRGEHDGSVIAHACADLYVAGHLLDWATLHRLPAARALPGYPWQRKRFWKESPEIRRVRLGELEHPLLGSRHDAPTPTWRRQLDGSRPPWLADHRVMDDAVFPGAGYVEMALAAGHTVFSAAHCVLEDVRFEAPTLLRDDHYVLETTLDTRTGAVTIHGRAPDAEQWTAHASARLVPARAGARVIDLAATRAACPQQWERERCYERFRAIGFDYGPAFQPIERLWFGPQQALARLAPDAAAHAPEDDLLLDPRLLDGCTQALLPLVEERARTGAALLPIGADAIVVHARPTGELWAVATAREGDGDELVGDVVLVGPDGRAIVEIEGFRARILHSEAPAARRLGSAWLHHLTWEPHPLDSVPEVTEAPRTWLLLADRVGLAAALADALSADGDEVVIAHRGHAFSQPAPDRFELQPAARGEIDALVATVAARQGPPVHGVVHLWSAEAAADDLAAGTLEWPAREGPLSLLHLVQALHAAERAWPLTTVTVGAQPVDGPLDARGLLQSPLWGMSRVLHHESLALGARTIDLDPERPLADVQALVSELRCPPDEDQVALRGGERRIARMYPTPDAGAPLPLRLRADGSYLITGGLGAIGLLVGRWLVERGARRLVLVNRSGLPPRGRWATLDPGHPQYPQVQGIRAIEALGAVVETARLDVAAAGALRRLVTSRRRRGLPPVCGAIHAAGSVRDRVLEGMEPDELLTVLAPKVDGAWQLHRALADAPLDFFVLFSSATSVVATPAQGNYAAANAFLDALAHWRRAQGLPGLAIGWGPWDTGMIAQLGLQPLFEQRGVDLISERVGLELLARLIGSAEVHQVALSAHWPTVVASYPIVPRLMERLGGDADNTKDAQEAGASVAELLAAAPREAQPAIVADACTAIVSGVLRVPAVELARDEPLNQLGLDSMLAVEVRIRLEQAFGTAPNVVFLLQGATTLDLAEAVEAERLARVAADTQPDDVAALLAELDAETAEALLAEVEIESSVEPMA